MTGILPTFGFAILQPKVEKLLGGINPCGVMSLHGMLGVLGCITAIFSVDGIAEGIQFLGIGVTIIVAIVTGFIAGKIIAVLARRTDSYNDTEEFEL